MQEGLAQLRNRLFRKSPLHQPGSDLVASAIELGRVDHSRVFFEQHGKEL